MGAPRQGFRIAMVLRSLIVVSVVAFTAVFVSLAAVSAVRDAVELTGSVVVVHGPGDDEIGFAGYTEGPGAASESADPACGSECSPLALSFVSQWWPFQIPGWGGL